ncbi:sigma-70 family RNA polymerase sigma factor [Galbibacter sp. EGI 63066]|uniref:RNA polymerase sigma factor n=1 Tax=Galbibacter sp. EGI 63066 TaxID=2993559 RepID=UPI00224948E7|nr:sigma-70 family RNA polymerase sigma factor [Galbibacter sp. EGI 63066]MCX2681164.1 sigma-70 family RNA polymerase sigma factor [Galbibacter sp. EGI 63066]
MTVKTAQIKEHIDRAKVGDQISFSFLLDHFWSDVYSFQLLRTRNENEAEDITIRTFSKAFDKIDTYNSNYEFKTWLITISKNIHIDLIRKKKSELLIKASRQEENTVYNLADDTPTAEDKLITEQNLATLLQHIKKLKPHYQKVINLRYFQELSYEEIAKELNEPLNNIKVKLLRAKKLLAGIITKKK